MASVVIMCVSETIEFIETTETVLALDWTGEMWGSLNHQDTMRRAMEGMCYPHRLSAIYVYAYGGDVLYKEDPGRQAR